MVTTLTVNPGSASKKYALYKEGELLVTITFEKISETYGKCVEVNGLQQRCESATEAEYSSSLAEALTIMQKEKCIETIHDVTHVGVRVVAPGTFFQTHRRIDEAYLRKLKEMQIAAPLHVTATLAELKAVHEQLAHALIVGVSDSAFHSTIPDYARTYSIPYEESIQWDVYRFGYHGLSASAVTKTLIRNTGRMPERLIIGHIGSGVSVTALKDGKSVETSMGFTPASGLMMGTRVGNLDPGALLYILSKKILRPSDAHAYLNREGGLKGMLGQGDLRIALERMQKGDARAALAIHMYMYGIQKQIGASIAALGGLDTLVLTATAAERNPVVRELLCENLEYLGIVLDAYRNEALVGRGGKISSDESRVEVYVMHTDEMQEIADIASGF